jgi:hypothetical protein
VADPDSKKPPDDAGGSGSVEVQLSSDKLAAAAPEPVPPDESAPVSSGKVQAVEAAEQTGPARRSGRLSAAVSGGVERLGAGIEIVGDGVSKLGEVTKKVPLVGAGVSAIGESLTKAGESISILPQVTATRRGRLLVRSVIVGLLLVATWITAIVAWELRTNDAPDFRPVAERILVEISKGPASIEKVYDSASPRFLEVVKKERFVDDMTDLDATLGKFREITAVNTTLVAHGPTGRTGRLTLTVAFERGTTRAAIWLHWDQGQWKLLGISVEVPPELKITQAQREQRVAACLDDKGHDVSYDRKKCPVRDAAETILEQLRDGKAGDVWDAASPVFQKQESRDKFAQLHVEHERALGKYVRLLDVTEAKMLAGTTATFDVVAEFELAKGVRVVFGFERDAKSSPWKLRSFKLVVPMPRAEDETGSATTPAPMPSPTAAGSAAAPRR